MNPGAAPRHTDPRGDSLVKDCPSHSLEAPRHAPPVARGLYSRRNGPRVSDAVTRHRMSAHLLLLLGVLTVAAAAPYTPCNYGQSFVDQCENQCECIVGGGYACTRKGCLGAGTAGIPLACKVEGDIRVERNIGYVCQNGIVHLKPAHGHDTCSPGASWKHRCNTCTCSASGFVICTKIACIVPDRKPILSGGNSIPTLEFGDLAIASERPCPAGLQEGVSFLFSKVCRGQGCTPGVTWTVKGGCSSCVCTKDGEPACTPCRREPTQCVPDTTYNIKCDVCLCQKDGAPACTKRDCTLPKYGDLQVCDAEYRDCPADCGVAGADSYCKHCQCGPRLDEGDIVIGIDEPCPLNFVHKANQWATKTCKPATSCQYGPAYIDECGNTCECQNGVYGCTRKACQPEQTPEKPVPCANPSDLPRLPNTRVICHDGIVKLQDPDAACLPGSVFLDREYCNSCFCSDAGAAGCTLKACIQVPQCQYGPSYIDECGNTCECQNGVYGCTRKACRPGQTPDKPVPCFNSFDLPRVPNRRVICHDGIVKLQDLDADCLPGSVFLDKEYCNSCFCSETGIGGCTLKACIQATSCQYGPAYIDECGNTCNCEGSVYGCTRKPCRPGQTSEKPVPCANPSDLPRLPNTRVICHDGIVKLQALDAACLPGSVFLDKEYCNSCSCGDAGVAGCTLKACIQVPQCQYGPSYIDECGNTCECQNGVYGCTRKACRPGQTPEKPVPCSNAFDLPRVPNRRVICHDGIVKLQDLDATCLSGSVFLDSEYCNSCFCSETGIAGCTLKACIPELGQRNPYV